jgi:hypothetical protein
MTNEANIYSPARESNPVGANPELFASENIQ